MHRIASLFVGLLLGVIVVVPLGASVAAQSGLPVYPDPAECTIEPLTADEFRAVLGTRVGSPTVEATNFTLPTGAPADERTTEAVIAVLRQALACRNAGDNFAIFALATKNFLASAFGAISSASDEEIADFAATPENPAAMEQTSLVNVREVTVLADRRVGALVDTSRPGDEQNVENIYTYYYYFAQEDGTWKFDEIVDNLGDEYSVQGA